MVERGAPMFDEDGKFLGYRGTSRDITKRKREERLLALEHTVARGLADADSTTKILRTVMQLVCESEQWDSAGYWTIDERRRMLRLTTGWMGTNRASATQDYYKDSLGVTLPADTVGAACGCRHSASEIMSTTEPIEPPLTPGSSVTIADPDLVGSATLVAVRASAPIAISARLSV